MKLGALDVLPVPFESRELMAAIQQSIRRSGDSQELRAETAVIRGRLEALTHRELDLLRQVVAGKSNKQIAPELGISIKTVAKHRIHLMTKMQALNAADLARMSMIAGVDQENLPADLQLAHRRRILNHWNCYRLACRHRRDFQHVQLIVQ
jgi:FixJ family two-component response regulator